MITSLTLKNFKKHKHLHLNFSDSSNILIGHNTSGKSSILQAIAFGLYGAACVPGKKDHLLTWGESAMAVEVGLRLKDQDVVIRRTLSACSAKVGDTKVAEGTKAVTDFLTSHLQMDVKEFNTFVYAAQGQTAGLLEYGATALQKLIERIAKISVIDGLTSAISADKSSTEGKLSVLTPVDVSDLSKTVQELTLTLDNDKKVIGDLHGRLELLAAELTRTSESYAEGVKHNDLVKAEKYRRAILWTKRDELDGDMQAVASLVKDKDVVDLVPFQTELADLTEQIESGVICRSKKEVLVAELDQLHVEEEDLVSVRVQHEEARPTIDSMNQRLNAVLETKNQLTTEYAQAKRTLEMRRRSMRDSICGECKRPYEKVNIAEMKAALGEQERLVTEKEAEAISATEEFDSRQRTLTTYMKSLPSPSLTEANVRLKAIEDKILQLKSEVERCSDGSTVDIDSLTMRKEEVEQQLLHAVKENEAVRQYYVRLKDMGTALDKVLGELQKVEQDPLPDMIDTDKLSERRDTLTVQKDEVHKEIHGKEQVLSEVISNLTTAKRELKAGATVNEQISELSTLLNSLAKLLTYLRNKRAEFLTQIWAAILQSASVFCSNMTSGVISQLRRDDDGAFSFMENGRDCPISAASGFQRALLGVSLRLAIGRVLHGSAGFLMLDEPTAEMDEKNAAVFHQSLTQMNLQTLVISHREMDRMAAENIIQLGGSG